MKNLNNKILAQVGALAQAGCKIAFSSVNKLHIEITVDKNDRKRTRYIETAACYDQDVEEALQRITDKITKPMQAIDSLEGQRS